MKVRDMIGPQASARPTDLEYDQDECDRYVSRFIAAMDADTEEIVKAENVTAIHLEVASKADLYIAIYGAMGSRYRTGLRAYLNQWKLR